MNKDNLASVVRQVINIILGAIGVNAAEHEDIITALVSLLVAISMTWWTTRDNKVIKETVKAETETALLKRNNIQILALCLLPFISGCASYRHDRSFNQTTGVVTETTYVRGFFARQAITNLKSSVNESTKTNGLHTYARRIGFDAAASETDSAGIDALSKLLGTVAREAAAGAGKAILPVP